MTQKKPSRDARSQRKQMPQKVSRQVSEQAQNRKSTAWHDQAASYDQQHGAAGDMHHQQVIIPAILRHLCRSNPARVIDCCCGQGVVARAMVQQGMDVWGIDGSQGMIDAATQRGGAGERYVCADAHDLDAVLTATDNDGQLYDAAVISMALQDLNPFEDVLQALHKHMRVGASVIAVVTHPCFRVPQHSDWHYDRRRNVQARMVSSYMSEQSLSIEHRQGDDQQSQTSSSFHRPISTYIRSFAQAGMPLIDSEELCTPKRGSTGERSVAEDHAAREIPMFLLMHGCCVAK